MKRAVARKTVKDLNRLSLYTKSHKAIFQRAWIPNHRVYKPLCQGKVFSLYRTEFYTLFSFLFLVFAGIEPKLLKCTQTELPTTGQLT